MDAHRAAAGAKLWISMRLVTCTLLLSVIAPPAAAVASDTLAVTAVPVSGGFEIQVRDREPQSPPGPAEAASGEVRLTLAAEGEAVVLVAQDAAGAVKWRGRVRPLWGYGRVGLPGLELAWEAVPGETLYGLGERFNALDQYGRRCEMWIKDSPGAGPGLADSYFCTPVLYSSRGYGVFACDNPEGDFDLNSGGDGLHRYRRVGRALRLFLVFGRDLKELVVRRGALQGPFRGIPDWAWGPWISRNSYETQAEALAALEGMAARGWPVAAIVQEAWKGRIADGDYNRFSAQRWPDPEGYFDAARRLDVRTVLWQVPVLHPGAPEYAEAAARELLVRAPDRSVSLRAHWLAGFANLDFTHPATAEFWGALLQGALRPGVGAIKADDGEEIQPTDVFHDGRRGWELHNEYAVLHNAAVLAILDAQGIEGLLWARGGSLGVERTPALWAGDQFATWDQLRALLPAGLSTGLSGMPFWGHDIGGYGGTPSPELYIRWLQFGSFSPLMQYHGITPREPWLFGKQAEAAYDRLVKLRMALRPTLIALGREAAATGLPLMRPMALEFPADPRFAREETQYLLGPDLLVAPVLEEGALGRRVRFPAGAWQHLVEPVAWDGPADVDVPIGLAGVPVFVREGATLAAASRSSTELAWAADAPHVAVSYARARALIRNPRAPLLPDVLTSAAVLSFEADEAVATTLLCESAAVGTSTPQRIVPRREGEHWRVELPLPSGGRITGRRQAYALARGVPGGESAPVFTGELRWNVPLAFQVETGHRAVSGDERRTLITQLHNADDEPLEVEITARADAPARLDLGVQHGRVDPGDELMHKWVVDLPGAGSAASQQVHFDVRGHGQTIVEATRWFAPQWRWVVVGPFPAAERTAHRTAFGPEVHTAPGVAFQAGGRVVRWEQATAGPPPLGPGLDFEQQFGSLRHAAAYALTRLESEGPQDVEFWFGSDDTLTVWLNGAPLYEVENYRAATPDQERVPARLVAGTNTLVIKIGQGIGLWQFYARVTAPGGGPLSGVRDGFGDFEAYAPRRSAPDEVRATPDTWAGEAGEE